MKEDENKIDELNLRDQLAIAIFSSLLPIREEVAIHSIGKFIEDKNENVNWATNQISELVEVSYFVADIFRKQRLKAFK